MSLYNQLFGFNPFAAIFVKVAGLHHVGVPRFRDCFLERNKDGVLEIVLYTRSGGPNRDDYEKEHAIIAEMPNYLRTVDDDFDTTYAKFYFSIQDEIKEPMENLAAIGGIADPAGKWKTMLEKLNNDIKDESTKAAMVIGDQVAQAFGLVKKTDK